MTKKNIYIVSLIFLVCFLFFLPFIINPKLLLNRNNDLQEYYDNMRFFQSNIQIGHIPLWQNRVLSGTPFLGDPQNPLLYLPNYIVRFIPLDAYFSLSFFLNFVLATIGAYYLGRVLKFDYSASLWTALVYGLSPKFIAHLEAGHLSLLAAYSWIPVFVAFMIQMRSRFVPFISILAGFSGAMIFINFLTLGIISLPVGLMIPFIFHKTSMKNQLLNLTFCLVTFFLITFSQLYALGVTLPLTTRNLISFEDLGTGVVSMRRYIASILWPYWYALSDTHTESVLYIGVVPLFLAILGYFRLTIKLKILLGFILFAVIIASLGSKTNLFLSLLRLFSQLMSIRIFTRLWFIVILLVAVLGGYAFTTYRKKTIILILCIALFLEYAVFGFQYFKIKDSVYDRGVNSKLLTNITDGTSYYRVYCTFGCGIDLTDWGKGLANGYNPINLLNYYHFIQKAAGYTFASYTVMIPPYQTYVDKPQPDAALLGELGVRYVISAYRLEDKGFDYQNEVNGQLIYKNHLEKPRVYKNSASVVPIAPTLDLPGKVIMPVSGKGEYILNEIFHPLWEVYDDQGRKYTIKPHADITLSTTINDANIKQLTFRYGPGWFRPLVKISLSTSGAILFLLSAIFIRSVLRPKRRE